MVTTGTPASRAAAWISLSRGDGFPSLMWSRSTRRRRVPETREDRFNTVEHARPV